jgi:hypothetical protein
LSGVLVFLPGVVHSETKHRWVVGEYLKAIPSGEEKLDPLLIYENTLQSNYPMIAVVSNMILYLFAF